MALRIGIDAFTLLGPALRAVADGSQSLAILVPAVVAYSVVGVLIAKYGFARVSEDVTHEARAARFAVFAFVVALWPVFVLAIAERSTRR